MSPTVLQESFAWPVDWGGPEVQITTVNRRKLPDYMQFLLEPQKAWHYFFVHKYSSTPQDL